MDLKAIAFVCCLSAAVLAAPQQQRPLPADEKPVVAILKQINKINPDGSYTYGFEAEDGSFRVETRDVHGNVRGKYGYVDESGQVKSVEYEAGRPQGFQPHGNHLPVIPRPSASSANEGNVDDEFGTDEDWQSVDADEDGEPDPPRPLSERGGPVRPLQPIGEAQQVQRVQPVKQQQSEEHRERPFFLPQVPRQTPPAGPAILPQRFNGPLFPFQFASAPVGAAQRFVPFVPDQQ